MTHKEAKRLSILKWERLAKGDPFDEVRQMPELVNLIHSCGYCEKYHNNGLSTCQGCPLNLHGDKKRIDDASCAISGHPYNNWMESKTKEDAQIVLDLIKSK